MTTNYRPHTRMKKTSKFNTAYGPVKIIPASAMRNDLHFAQPSFSQDPRATERVAPVNPPYYMGYTHTPYGQNSFVDPYTAPSCHYYGRYEVYYPGYNYNQHVCPMMGAYGGQPSQSNAYQPYPQPSPPHRRSRTAPSRTTTRNAPNQPTTNGHAGWTTDIRLRNRGFSADPSERRLPYQVFSTSHHVPTIQKKSQPLYRKRKEAKNWEGYPESDFGGAFAMDYSTTFGRPYASNVDQFATLDPSVRRVRPYYAPSYTTYPPSTMHRLKKKERPQMYPLFARIALKAAQLILGAAILTLILGPMASTSFHDFVIRTKTEWQGAVVGITAVFAILTAVLLVTSFLADKLYAWRKLDAWISCFGVFCYLLSGFIEAYFAACYPPNGKKINLVCHRAEWIIATVLIFINFVLYVIDFVMTWLSGVTML